MCWTNNLNLWSFWNKRLALLLANQVVLFSHWTASFTYRNSSVTTLRRFLLFFIPAFHPYVFLGQSSRKCPVPLQLQSINRSSLTICTYKCYWQLRDMDKYQQNVPVDTSDNRPRDPIHVTAGSTCAPSARFGYNSHRYSFAEVYWERDTTITFLHHFLGTQLDSPDEAQMAPPSFQVLPSINWQSSQNLFVIHQQPLPSRIVDKKGIERLNSNGVFVL